MAGSCNCRNPQDYALLQKQYQDLKEQNDYLIKCAESLQEEFQSRKESIIRNDLDEEGRDREHISDEIEELKLAYSRVKEELLIAAKKADIQRDEKEYVERELQKFHKEWSVLQQKYKAEIQALLDEVELLQKKDFHNTQDKSEEDERNSKLWKEKYLKEKEDHLDTLKELDRVMKQLESFQAEVLRQLIDPVQTQRDLQQDIATLTLEKEKMQDELRRMRKEMDTLYGGHLPQNLGMIQSEKVLLEKELESMRFSLKEEQRKAMEKHGEFKVELEKMSAKHEQEIRQLYNQLRLQDMVRKKLADSLKASTQHKTNIARKSDNTDHLLIDLAVRDDSIAMYRKEMQKLRDRLEQVEVSNSRYQCDIQSMKLNKIKLENEITHYRMLNASGIDPNIDFGDYNRSYKEVQEMERQKDLYASKYRILIYDYLKVWQLAVQNGLELPPRSGSPHPSHPEHLSDVFIGQGSNDGSFQTENALLVNIDDEIQKAAESMEGKIVELDEKEDSDPRPFDTNLICPVCVKQFRIGQIQNFRSHVENCHKK